MEAFILFAKKSILNYTMQLRILFLFLRIPTVYLLKTIWLNDIRPESCCIS